MKVAEYNSFVGPNASIAEKSELWETFVQTDTSPYRSLYSGVRYRWAYFQCMIMVLKGALCAATLGFPQNSTGQLVVVMLIQMAFLILVFVSAPFLVEYCTWIMALSQSYVLFTLFICCLYRINPESVAWGWILNVTAFVCIIAQVGLVCIRRGKRTANADAQLVENQHASN